MEDHPHKPTANLTTLLEAEVNRLRDELARKSREIEVEKALEKIRVKALDMRNSSELSETSTLLFQQLKDLKIEAIRSGLGIFDDENNAIELWITSVSNEGKLFFILDYINIDIHPVFENIMAARREKKPFSLTVMEGRELAGYYRTMSTYGGIPARRETSSAEYYYSFFFSAGTINVVTATAMTREETGIMLRMANVFGLIFTRFLDLKRSEEQAVLISEEKRILEDTLENLKATQNQLIQSEKMASLGEMTAGIAHEIQNPLNFVNNFSEVSNELMDDMHAAILEGAYAEAREIAEVIKQNLEKVRFHGNRADAIVKSMLQHSRSSSGRRELTDINALCEEYFRLAYHGMRARDKTFNVEMKTDLDPQVGKANVAAQDIGRVVLNLLNNAFYAVSDRKKRGQEGYQPFVSLSTRKLEGSFRIIVEDNGPGIPEKVIDKIFQPFFTTRPAGQGTGLGLSLSFDIVKAHAGKIDVVTREGEGTAFQIDIPC
ncbi:MAG TPA: ATP-binding protein [Chitinophagaceae bacterium]|nr:ATP-binding protein [Chitinophagaceae bacterium]